MWALEDLKRSMGSADFSAQYLQQPVPRGGNLIKWDWFQTYDELPWRDAGDHVIVSWDTAMSGSELSDYSACVVLHVKGETVYVLDVVRERLEYPDLRRKVIEVHRRWKNYANSYALVIEDRGSGTSLIQDLKREGIGAIGVKPTADKAIRMNAHTARIEAGHVHLPRKAGWLEEFRRELMLFPAGKYDDQVDALSQGLDRAFAEKRVNRTYGAKGMY